MKKIITLILFISLFCGCNDISDKPITHIKSYPYYASQQRTQHIIENYKKIQKEMNHKDLLNIIGEPDEIRPLYEPKHNEPREPVGTTWWYIIQRKQENGSIIDKDEKLVRYTLDKSDKIYRIDKWGF